MKREGEIRIPSGCAVSAVISRNGNKMTGEDIIKSMLPMHDRSNGLGGGSQATEFITNTAIFMLFIFFSTTMIQGLNVNAFSRRILKLSRPSPCPSEKFPR